MYPKECYHVIIKYKAKYIFRVPNAGYKSHLICTIHPFISLDFL